MLLKEKYIKMRLDKYKEKSQKSDNLDKVGFN